MACFIVPVAEAVVTTVIQKAVKNKEIKSMDNSDDKIRLSEKLGWLNGMLWGGSGLLAFEHIWHGEIVPWFPFLTNAANPIDAAEMLHEMAVSGSAMAALVTIVWFMVSLAADKILKHKPSEITEEAGI